MSTSTTTPRIGYRMRKDAVTATYAISAESRARFKEIAHRSGMSAGRFLEVLADKLPLDDNGIPLFLSEQAAERNEEPKLKAG